DKVIDKLTRTVEKDADFVISSPSAYKGTTGLEKAKSLKAPDFRGFLFYDFNFLLHLLFTVKAMI
ncbi:MAG: hypothetical protein IKL24_00190, partial [Clostridia bacterium]|nr:hypothetical protein [Clostridia bacterium]